MVLASSLDTIPETTVDPCRVRLAGYVEVHRLTYPRRDRPEWINVDHIVRIMQSSGVTGDHALIEIRDTESCVETVESPAEVLRLIADTRRGMGR